MALLHFLWTEGSSNSNRCSCSWANWKTGFKERSDVADCRSSVRRNFLFQSAFSSHCCVGCSDRFGWRKISFAKIPCNRLAWHTGNRGESIDRVRIYEAFLVQGAQSDTRVRDAMVASTVTHRILGWMASHTFPGSCLFFESVDGYFWRRLRCPS